MKNDNVFAVLGATGKVGGAAIHELRRRGCKVRAVVRDPIKADTLKRGGVELAVAVADARDRASLAQALAGASHVIQIMQTSLRRTVVGQDVVGESRVQLLTAAGISESYARLVTEMWDAHNAGRIEVEPGSDVRRGSSPLETIIAEQLARL
jgi:uncharacterized protein YbjT (DUF2867 family)